jgi:hypothetical protein
LQKVAEGFHIGFAENLRVLLQPLSFILGKFWVAQGCIGFQVETCRVSKQKA